MLTLPSRLRNTFAVFLAFPARFTLTRSDSPDDVRHRRLRTTVLPMRFTLRGIAEQLTSD